MLETLLRRDNGPTPLPVRTALGIVDFPQGAQEVPGRFGGLGDAGGWGWKTGQRHIGPGGEARGRAAS